jgi:hypothetical protein
MMSRLGLLFGGDGQTADRRQFGGLIQRVLARLEQQGPAAFRFSDVADCDKRRQSDLFNILDALDVFVHVPDKQLVWRGFTATPTAFVQIGIHNEIQAQSESIAELFSVGPSPSLPVLVVKFVSLYVFLGVKCLNIREVVNLMADTDDQAKKILRRLYLVVFVLEQLQIVEHGFGYSQYILRLPLDSIVEAVFEEIARSVPFPEGSEQALINRFDGEYIRNVHKHRIEGYMEAVARFQTEWIDSQ